MITALKTLIVVTVCFALMITMGCSRKSRSTGFLTDYSRLDREKGSLRYIDMNLLMDEWAKRFRKRLDEAHGN